MKFKAAIDYEAAFQNWKRSARRTGGKDFIVLDLGHDSINALYAKIGNSGEVTVLDYASARGTGYSDGVISEPNLFSSTIDRVIGDLRKRNHLRIKKIDVTFSAPFIGSFNHFISVPLTARKRVTLKLVEEAIKSARGEISNLVEHVIQVVPVRFTLDSIYSGAEPPLGMGGNHLGVELLFITAPEASLEQIELALHETGYGVSNWWYAGISSSESVMVPSSEAGVAVADIGCGSTDVTVYQYGRLMHLGTIERGGRDIDSGLAEYLNESLKVAEEVKRQFGCALPQVVRFNEMIDLRERGLASNKLISAREVANVIRHRVQEILFSIEEEIGRALPPNRISRLILTGGTAKLQGLPELAEMTLQRGIEVGSPSAAQGTFMGFTDPSCAALIGTLRILRRKHIASFSLDPAAMTTTQRMKSWFGALVSTQPAEQRELP